MSTRKIFIILSAFIVVLTILRLLWINVTALPDHPKAIKGQLDLRNWEPITEHVIRLDGEWEFYPNVFLMEEQAAQFEKINIQVPENLSAQALPAEPFGYGSYRLRILINPENGRSFGIRPTSIYSSSELYVNGELIANSGKPAADKSDYIPFNAPHNVFFTVEDTDEIELIIHVANFDHPLKAGIVRSITFGLTKNFAREANFSTNIDIIACALFLFHALYSFILFLLSNRNKSILYFSFMILCIVLGTLLSDRLLFQLLPFSYGWNTKLVHLTLIAGSYFFLQSIKSFLPDRIRAKLITPYAFFSGILALVTVILPVTYNLYISFIFTCLALLTCSFALLVIFRATKKIDGNNIYLLLAAVAAIYSLVWLVILRELNIEIVSYPFDLIIATICFSIYWFRRYFGVLTETQQLTKKLQKANEQKDEFLTAVAHEMRNPLHSILNISEAVKEREKDKLRQSSSKDLELIITIGRHMAVLLNILLDLERLRENKIQLQRNNISVHAIANAVIDMNRYKFAGKTISVVNRIPEDFPLLYADKNRIIQILFNLLDNALKYSHANEISFEARIAGNWAKISVRDNGIGIKKEFLQHIFGQYKQDAYEHSVDNSGLGMGLYICNKLVQLHGGALNVHSKENEGTVFTFTLPLADTAAQPATNTSRQPPEEKALATIINEEYTKSAQITSTLQLLVVDDDPVNLKVLQSVFSEVTYNVITAASGEEALAILESAQVDIVIADVMMPKMSGYELTKLIRKKYSLYELPILLLTARNQPEDIVAGFLAGANDYVAKPAEGYELKARVNTLTYLKKSIEERFQMEAALLQAQIQPHFLFNTIDTIASLSEIDTARMTELLVEFGNYLKKSFDPKNLQPLVPLEQELELVSSYLYIEKQRFGERLSIVWNIDAKTKIKVPPLSIQTLVENAVKHGVLKRWVGGTIQIRITELKQSVEVAIIDDGVGMSEEKIRDILEADSIKGGIRNINRRLMQLFGQGLDIISQPNKGTTIVFYIPKTTSSS